MGQRWIEMIEQWWGGAVTGTPKISHASQETAHSSHHI